MKRIAGIGLSLVLFSAAACGSARVTHRTQDGGTIALQGDRNKAMEDANRQMAGHCGPGNYTIVEEGEVIVGQDTVHDEETYVTDDGEAVVTEGGQSTRQATEWRITYQCNQ